MLLISQTCANLTLPSAYFYFAYSQKMGPANFFCYWCYSLAICEGVTERSRAFKVLDCGRGGSEFESRLRTFFSEFVFQELD